MYGNNPAMAASKPVDNVINNLGISFNGFNILPNIKPNSLIAINGNH